MKALKYVLATALFALVPTGVSAALITFEPVGSVDVSGYVQFDDSTFTNSSSDFIDNTEITDLSLTVMGFVFVFSDVDGSAKTVFDNSGPISIIDNGAGALAFNGFETIAFFPGGDGDASLYLDTDGDFDFFGAGWEHVFEVQWVQQVPEPATLGMFAIGLVGLGVMTRRRRKRVEAA